MPSNALLRRPWSLQDASKSSPDEALEASRHLQELSRGISQASSCRPTASGIMAALSMLSYCLLVMLSVVACSLFKLYDLGLFTFRLGTAECAERLE